MACERGLDDRDTERSNNGLNDYRWQGLSEVSRAGSSFDDYQQQPEDDSQIDTAADIELPSASNLSLRSQDIVLNNRGLNYAESLSIHEINKTGYGAQLSSFIPAPREATVATPYEPPNVAPTLQWKIDYAAIQKLLDHPDLPKLAVSAGVWPCFLCRTVYHSEGDWDSHHCDKKTGATTDSATRPMPFVESFISSSSVQTTVSKNIVEAAKTSNQGLVWYCTEPGCKRAKGGNKAFRKDNARHHIRNVHHKEKEPIR